VGPSSKLVRLSGIQVSTRETTPANRKENPVKKFDRIMRAIAHVLRESLPLIRLLIKLLAILWP
jgi:hypothetical protein